MPLYGLCKLLMHHRSISMLRHMRRNPNLLRHDLFVIYGACITVQCAVVHSLQKTCSPKHILPVSIHINQVLQSSRSLAFRCSIEADYLFVFDEAERKDVKRYLLKLIENSETLLDVTGSIPKNGSCYQRSVTARCSKEIAFAQSECQILFPSKR